MLDVLLMRALAPAVGLVFFLSGATGLAYQVIWFKRLSHVWGSSSLATAAVVASFLGGLGLGAWLLGRLADRVRSPLLWYGAIEGAIGVLALLLPWELHGLTVLASGLHPLLVASPTLHTLARILLTFAVLGPPCVLMGGTLPLLVRHAARPGEPLGRSAGWLYGINTLGAAAGCYLAGFHLLPGLGLHWTSCWVAGGNLAIAIAAMAMARRVPPPLSGAAAAPRAGDGASVSRGAIHAAAALTGCAALVLEMVWARQLALILGGSTYAFASMLLLVLAGIGAGSLIFHLARERLARLDHAAPLVIAAISLSAAAGKQLIPEVTAVVGSLGPLRDNPARNAAVCIAASAVLELLPAIGMGVLFPLLVELTRRGREEAGRAVGLVYASNTLGSIAGAAGTTVFLIPRLGTAGATAFALGLYVIGLIALTPQLRGWRASAAFFILCAIAGTGAFASLRVGDPRLTNRGAYLYGPPSEADLEAEVLQFTEGSSSNVLVTRYGPAVSLRVNGKVDASNSGDMKMQLAAAYLPLFLAPQARDALVIGFGSGTTAGAVLLFPEVRVTCAEIEPAVLDASRHFHDVNHQPEASPRFTAVVDDGRSYLQGTSAALDLILSEPSNPWLAGVSSLYSREYYAVVRQRLRPGGILAQWIQTYSFSATEYALVAATVLEAFPHAALARISDGDTILLASDRPLAADRSSADLAQELVGSLKPVRLDLERHFQDTDVRSILLTHLLLDSDGLRLFIERNGTGGANTDLNLRLEFDAPLQLFRRASTSEAIGTRIQDAMDARRFRMLAETLGCGPAHAEAFHKLAILVDKSRRPELVLELIDIGLGLDPRHPALLADRLIVNPPAGAGELERAVEDLARRSRTEAVRAASFLLRDRRAEEARRALEVLATLAPGSVTSWTFLARAHQALGDTPRAREALAKALALDPDFDEALRLEQDLARTP